MLYEKSEVMKSTHQSVVIKFSSSQQSCFSLYLYRFAISRFSHDLFIIFHNNHKTPFKRSKWTYCTCKYFVRQGERVPACLALKKSITGTEPAAMNQYLLVLMGILHGHTLWFLGFYCMFIGYNMIKHNKHVYSNIFFFILNVCHLVIEWVKKSWENHRTGISHNNHVPPYIKASTCQLHNSLLLVCCMTLKNRHNKSGYVEEMWLT